MDEFFLHFIWQHQYFDKQHLITSNDEQLVILHPGYRNTNQGPDFSHARLLMEEIEWHGNVEIHLKASDWYQHRHQYDKNYDTIILHVVWENDCAIQREDGSSIPVLVLKERVDLDFINRYKSFVNSDVQLPCQYFLAETDSAYITAMQDRVFAERLERKGSDILKLYKKNQHDWEEVFWQVLVSNFGFKINNEAFAQLSRAVPYKLLLRHADSQVQLEALLFGQSGLLDAAPEDDYVIALKNEYRFLAHKYSLHDKKMNPHVWKFLRTRPCNFPTVRIAQLATLLKNCDQLINIIYEIRTVSEYIALMKAPVSDYWQEHYKFGEKIKGKVPGIAETMVHTIIINVVIPFKTARYMAGQSEVFPQEVYQLLEKLPAEHNKLCTEWKNASLKIRNAYDSQALIELYNQYCIKRKCLYCMIGNYIIRR